MHKIFDGILSAGLLLVLLTGFTGLLVLISMLIGIITFNSPPTFLWVSLGFGVLLEVIGGIGLGITKVSHG